MFVLRPTFSLRRSIAGPTHIRCQSWVQRVISCRNLGTVPRDTLVDLGRVKSEHLSHTGLEGSLEIDVFRGVLGL